ncbi:unnamed protein product [marine sediment metagenome]|uniref:Uncharacterized protein n=1 Tax=marine sediment metagenome TaxID=412755 RepID=X0X615_9ZZZZ
MFILYFICKILYGRHDFHLEQDFIKMKLKCKKCGKVKRPFKNI